MAFSNLLAAAACATIRSQSTWKNTMQRITPFLWFKDNAEEALDFYQSVFPGAKAGRISRPPDAPGPKGRVMVATIELLGTEFTLLNGGPFDAHEFSPRTSFVISCETQAEVDHYWSKLGEGGKHSQCGWLDDRFGVTWQVVPTALLRLQSDPDPARARKVTQAMLKMKKLVIADLEKAAAG
jgi:predicted 3-demethylubiquinone-9 3-methyltransferase (glyoxalase superfamily)